jgi:hypothetical protein
MVPRSALRSERASEREREEREGGREREREREQFCDGENEMVGVVM